MNNKLRIELVDVECPETCPQKAGRAPFTPYASREPAGSAEGVGAGDQDALGMSSLQLAKRVGVSPQAITGLEQSEALGAVRLNTLRRVAEGLDATLVYAIVPNTTLAQMVENKANRIARAAVEIVDHSMRLEGQATGAETLEEAITLYREDLRDRGPLGLEEAK